MAEVSLPVERPESSIQLWSNLADSLRHGGFGQAGPEYLKLAQMVAQVRRMQLVRSMGEPRPDDAEWAKLSVIASTVLTLLEPLREASRLLAELPTQLEARTLVVADTSATRTAAAPLHGPEPTDSSDALAAEPPRSTARSRRPTTKTQAPAKRQEAARALKGAGRKPSRETTRRARVANG